MMILFRLKSSKIILVTKQRKWTRGILWHIYIKKLENNTHLLELDKVYHRCRDIIGPESLSENLRFSQKRYRNIWPWEVWDLYMRIWNKKEPKKSYISYLLLWIRKNYTYIHRCGKEITSGVSKWEFFTSIQIKMLSFALWVHIEILCI